MNENFDEKKLTYEKEINHPEARFDINPIPITSDGKIVLVKRIPNVQEGGKWSFPGGKVFVGERIEDALKRMTELKTGLEIELLFPDNLNLNSVGIYDNPGRDPRSHVLGLAFLCKVMGKAEIFRLGGNSEDVKKFSIEEVKDLDLAFDHRQILEDVIEKISSLSYNSLEELVKAHF